jgi:hypothetical protein
MDDDREVSAEEAYEWQRRFYRQVTGIDAPDLRVQEVPAGSIIKIDGVTREVSFLTADDYKAETGEDWKAEQ